MKKAQSAPGTAKRVVVNSDDTYGVADVDTATLNPRQLRWIGSGRTVLNNKGNTVKQYEPYFSVSHKYEDLKELVETGVTPLMYYDARGRLAKTEMPDGTFSRTLFGAWKQIRYDANDTILESPWYHNRVNRLMDAELIAEGKDPVRERTAAEKAAKHADTPDVRCFDVMGRTVLCIEHNRDIGTDADEIHHTKLQVDVSMPADEGSWKALKEVGSSSREGNLPTAVGLVRGAVLKKATSAKGAIVALDAHHFGALVGRRLVDAYLAAHGSPVTEFGFADAWIIGPTEQSSVRLAAL
jgi:hypothetical protein